MWIPKLALAAQTLSKADKDSEGRKKITLEARSPFFNLLRFSMATWSGKLVLLGAQCHSALADFGREIFY